MLSVLLSTLGVLLFIEGLSKNIRRLIYRRGFLTYPVLFFLFYMNYTLQHRLLVIKLLFSANFFSALFFPSSSNHYIISLDICYIFSCLILIMFHHIKISKILPVK